MKFYSAMIVDDEKKASTLLNTLINEYCSEIDEVIISNDAEEAVELIQKNQPDLLFLDINMPKLNGFELLDNLENFQGHLIFTTAYDEYAIKAFKYHAFDYLLKPISPDQILDSVQRAIANISKKNHEPSLENIKDLLGQIQQKEEYKETIAINDKGGLLFIDVKSITHLEGQSNYTMVYTNEKRYTCAKTLKKFVEILDPNKFIRVHRSYVVNVSKIARYNPENTELEMINGSFIPVARRKRKELERFSV